jgi:Subtilase family
LQDAPNATYGIHLPGAWAITTGTTQIVIAVLDTGVLYSHPDLAHRLLPGYDFISDPTRANDGAGRDADATDPGNWVTKAEATSTYAGCYETNSGWHGTQMAGIIGAEANNQYGISGINWASPLLPVRVLGKCGGHLSDIVDGLRWAAGLPVLDVPPNAHPARVINVSLGAPDVCSPLLQNAIDEVTQRGAIVVVSAGNRAFNALYQTPANCNNVLVVGGTDQHGERGSYSNYGGSVHISAPGGDPANANVDRIAVTSNLGSTQAQTHTIGWVLGTSPAAAQVSGVVSLMLAQRPSLTLKEIIFLLGKTATLFPADGSCALLGCGLGAVNARGAVSAAATSTFTELFLPLIPIQSGSKPSLIRNGGFEAGADAWAVSSARGSLVIMNDAYMPPDVLAYAGNYAAWLGGVNDEVNAITQTISIPATGATLKFRWRLQSAETDCHNDVLTISINGTVVDSMGLCRSRGTSDWPEYTRSLNGFAGQNAGVQLKVKTNGSLSSNLFVDDVRVE